jgi:mediator of RNA polymerase II transcription subunit 5
MTGKEILDKLEHFRTVTLASLDFADGKKKEATDAVMDDIMDPALAMESVVLSEISVGNTRAGLYIYINALVSSSLSHAEQLGDLRIAGG